MTRLTHEQQADVERIIPAVWGTVRKTYHARSTAYTAEDVFQAAIEAVCRARTRWDPDKGSWLPYALTRAHGAILDFLRDQRPGSRHYPAENPLSLDAHLIDADSDTPLDRISAYQDPEPSDPLLEAQLWRAIDGLPGGHGNVFRLYAEADLTMAEVSRLVGVTESRVSQIVTEACTWLQPTVLRLTEAAA